MSRYFRYDCEVPKTSIYGCWVNGSQDRINPNVTVKLVMDWIRTCVDLGCPRIIKKIRCVRYPSCTVHDRNSLAILLFSQL